MLEEQWSIVPGTATTSTAKDKLTKSISGQMAAQGIQRSSIANH